MSLRDRYEKRRRSIYSKLAEIEIGVVFFLGVVAVLIGLIYLLGD
jgi:hypothetical protein